MVSLTFVATMQRAPLGLTQGPVKFSHEFYWPIGHSHTTAAVRPGREENAEETQGGVKMKNWARARPKIKFLKNVPKIFYRWPLTYVTLAES